MPRKLERQVRFFAAYPETGFVYGDAIMTVSPTTALRDSADAIPVNAAEPPPARGSTSSTLPRSIVTSTVAVRRDALDAVGHFDADLDAPRAEQDLWTRLASRYAVGHLPLPVAVVRAERSATQAYWPSIRRSQSLLHDT